MAHDVFISYSTQDKPIADAVCAGLEQRGIRCWIAPRDILAGVEWGQAIVEAISSARVMVLLLSQHANKSTQIPKEVDRAMNKGVTVIPLRIQDVQPTGTLEYHLGAAHWLDAINPPMESHIARLADNIGALLQRGSVSGALTPGQVAAAAPRAAAAQIPAAVAQGASPPPVTPQAPPPPLSQPPFAPPSAPPITYAAPLPEQPVQAGTAVAFYILAALVPIAGIILWAVYKDKPFPQDRSMATILLIIGIISMVVSMLFGCFCIVLGSSAEAM